MTKPMTYENLDGCGHILLTSQRLKQPFEVTGWVEVKLWVCSNERDADIFCYLESVDPESGQVE